jgi:hypothetical protein
MTTPRESFLERVCGMSGAYRKQRLRQILARPIANLLSRGGRILLASVELAALGASGAIAILRGPVGRAQSHAGPPVTFDAVSVKSSNPNSTPHGVGIGEESRSVRRPREAAYGRPTV